MQAECQPARSNVTKSSRFDVATSLLAYCLGPIGETLDKLNPHVRPPDTRTNRESVRKEGNDLLPSDTLTTLQLASQDVALLAMALQNLAAHTNPSASITPSNISKAKSVEGIVKLALGTAQLSLAADETVAMAIAQAEALPVETAVSFLSFRKTAYVAKGRSS